jgi:membrane protease subunit HflC
VIIAEAYRDAQKIKGEGDAKASACMPTPSAAIRSSRSSIAAWRPTAASFRSKSDVMVIDPSSDFFKAMRGGRLVPAAAPRRLPKR